MRCSTIVKIGPLTRSEQISSFWIISRVDLRNSNSFNFPRMSGKSKIKPLTAFIDYCCFNLSIVIARLQINVGNVNEQWSTVTLISKLNSLPYTDSANFYVNSIALSHGLLIFQKTLKYFGLDTVQIFQCRSTMINLFRE